MHRNYGRPSPALIVAVIALVAALAGSAVALPGKNKVDKNDLGKNVVRSKSIKRNAVKSKHLKNDRVKGKDVDESSLGQVPSAANAANAVNAATVGGAQLVKVDFRAPSSQGDTTILDIGGLTLTANCQNDTVEAGTSVDGAAIRSKFDETEDANDPDANNVEDETFDIGDVFSPVPDSANDEIGQISYVQPNGTQVTFQGSIDMNASFEDCVIAGFAYVL